MSRRKFSREFKQSAVKLVHEQGYTVAEAAQSLGVDGSTLRLWLKQFPATAGSGDDGQEKSNAEHVAR
jgi:transposase